MKKARVILLSLGIPGLLAYGTVAAAQWQAARALAEFEQLQKAHRPDSLTPPAPAVLAAKEAALLRAARFAPDHPEPAYQTALLRLVLAESASLQPAGPPAAAADGGPDPHLRALLRDALRAINQAISRNPGYADYHFVKATILQNLEATLPPEAGRATAGAVKHLLDSADRLDPYKPSLHYRIGSFYLALGERDRAKRAFSIALNDSDRYAEQVFGLLWSTGDVAEISGLVGSAALTRALLGQFLWSRGFEVEAEQEYARATGGRPMEFHVGELLVEQYFRTGRFEEARQVVGRVRKESPGLSMTERTRLLYLEGTSFLLEKRYQDAIARYEQALALDPEVYYIHQALGRIFLETGDYDRAIARFRFLVGRTSRALPPRTGAELRVDLARAYEKKSLFLDALNEYLRASQLDPANQAAQEKVRQLGRDYL